MHTADIYYIIVAGKLLKYSMKNRGPRLEPWGTAEFIVYENEEVRLLKRLDEVVQSKRLF
jgi:hypothetical protein